MKKQIVFVLLLLVSICSYGQDPHLWNGQFYNGVDRAWNFRVIDFSESKGYEVKAKLDLYQKNEDPRTNCAKIRVITAARDGESHAITLSQALRGIKKGKKYKVSYSVKSSISRKDNITIQIFSSNKTDKGQFLFTMCHSRKYNFNGDGEWKKGSFEFDAVPFKSEEKLDVENLKIRFCFGDRMGVYYLDDVKVERI